MQNVRIGFVGVGNMGQAAHLRNYTSLPGCEVVAIAELRPELARAVAARYGIPKIYPNAAEMLAHETLDGIVAIQQFDRHGIVLPELYRAGIPLLSEKPLAASLAVADQLLRSLEEGGSWHMVAYHKRCDPATVAAKQEIERLQQSGELGALRYARIAMPAGDWIAGGFNEVIRSSEAVPDTAADPPAQDMDAATYTEYVRFVNYYIHQVNLLRHLLGEPYHVTYADRAGMLLVGETDSGVTATIEMSPYQTTVDWQESALVAFERGYVRLDLPAPLALNRPGRVEILRDPSLGITPEVAIPQLPWSHAMREQAAAFVRAIRGEAPPPCEAREAVEDLRVAREYLRLWKG
jgi:predicted dehydrogenase